MSSEGSVGDAGAFESESEQSRPASARDRAAWRSPGAWVTLGVVLVVGLASDLISKYVAFERVVGYPVPLSREDVLARTPDRLGELIPPHEPVTVLPSLLDFTLVLNPGAVFGVGAGKRVLFIVFTVIALGFATALFASWTRARDRLAHASVGLLMAGGLGNLYDRLMYACVRDFIHPLPGVELPFGITWPGGSTAVWPYVSNVADLWLIIGIGALVIISLRSPDPVKATATEDRSGIADSDGDGDDGGGGEGDGGGD